MKKFFIISLMMVLVCSAFAHEAHKENTTAVYGTVGTFVLYFNAGINVERKIWDPGYLLLDELWLHGGFNGWKVMDKNGVSAVLSIHALTGKKMLHFEYGLGLTYIPGSATDWVVFPSVNFGVRYQKPGNSLILRTGIGFPEIAYLSAGYAF